MSLASTVKGLTQDIWVICPTDLCTRWSIKIYSLFYY